MKKFDITSGEDLKLINLSLDMQFEDWCNENNVPGDFRYFFKSFDHKHPKTTHDFYESCLKFFSAGQKSKLLKNAVSDGPHPQITSIYRPVMQIGAGRYGILHVQNDEVLTFSTNREAMIRAIEQASLNRMNSLWGSGASWIPRSQFSEDWTLMEGTDQSQSVIGTD